MVFAAFSFERLQKEWGPHGPVMRSYAIANRIFENDGRKIFNATAGGKLEVFPRVKYEDLFVGSTDTVVAADRLALHSNLWNLL